MALKFQLDWFTPTPVRVCGKGYRKTDRPTDRQTHTYRHTDRHTDRHIDRHTDVLSKTTFLDVLKVVHPNPVLSQTRFFFFTMPILP